MPSLIDALKSGATVGEVNGVMREVLEHGFHQVVFRMSRIDHIGIATNDISKASEFWLMIGLQQGEDHINLEQDVKIRMFHGNGENGSKTHSKVELIEALSEKSTIARFIARRGKVYNN